MPGRSKQKKQRSGKARRKGSAGLLQQSGTSSATMTRNVPPANWLARNVAGIPRFRKLVLVWNNNAGHSVGTGTFYEFPCLLNSAYLPGVSAGSGNFNNSKSALTYATQISEYSTCFVVGVRWHAWLNVAPQVGYEYSSMSNTATVGVTINNTSTPFIGSSLAIEQGMSKTTFLANNPDTVYYTGTLDIATGLMFEICSTIPLSLLAQVPLFRTSFAIFTSGVAMIVVATPSGSTLCVRWNLSVFSLTLCIRVRNCAPIG